jgi:hypothetical protein
MRADDRRLSGLLVELSELVDVAVDVVADLAHAFEREVLRVGEHPAGSQPRRHGS